MEKVVENIIKATMTRLNWNITKLSEVLKVSIGQLNKWTDHPEHIPNDIKQRIASLESSSKEASTDAPKPVSRLETDPTIKKIKVIPKLSSADVKRRRIAAGLTQNDFADALGVSKGAVGNWENGRTGVRKEYIEKILNLEKKVSAPQEVVEVESYKPIEAPKETLKEAPKPVISTDAMETSESISPSELRRIREKAGLSRQALAKMLKISPSAVGHWEGGRTNPRKKYWSQIIKLDVDGILKDKTIKEPEYGRSSGVNHEPKYQPEKKPVALPVQEKNVITMPAESEPIKHEEPKSAPLLPTEVASKTPAANNLFPFDSNSLQASAIMIHENQTLSFYDDSKKIAFNVNISPVVKEVLMMWLNKEMQKKQ